MNTLLLMMLVALCLGGCQLSLPRAVVLVDPAATLQKTMPAPQPPVGALDCDRDGLVSYEELQGGFEVNGRAVTRAEFDAVDGDHDAHWSEQEFGTFLHRSDVRSWSDQASCR